MIRVLCEQGRGLIFTLGVNTFLRPVNGTLEKELSASPETRQTVKAENV